MKMVAALWRIDCKVTLDIEDIVLNMELVLDVWLEGFLIKHVSKAES